MRDRAIWVYLWQQSARAAVWQRVSRDQRGEGVISAAIAVLVMAFLGVLMWVGFRATLGDAQGNVDNQINQIGQ
jgi:hypothetical protein